MSSGKNGSICPVMNHSTLEGVVHFYDHNVDTAWTVLKSFSDEPFPDTIGFKASLVQNASHRHHYLCACV